MHLGFEKGLLLIWNSPFCYTRYKNLELKPLHVSKVLTVWQQVVLGIHTHGTLVKTCIGLIHNTLKGVEIAFLLDHLKRMNLLDAVFTLFVLGKCNELKSDSIVKSLLVNYESELVFLACLWTGLRHIVLLGNHMDRIPTLSNGLLPESDFLGNLVVVGREFLEALGLFLIWCSEEQ